MSAAEQRAPVAPFHQTWRDLVARGYSPVPLHPIGVAGRAKAPCMSGWHPALRSRTVTEEEAAAAPALAGVGVVCGYRALIGIDVDSLDEEVQQIVLGALPEAPRRIGDPSKLGMLIYRYADSLSPPNQKFLAADGNGHVLEILGAGAQFVVGPTIHEKSGQPYHMADGGDLPPWSDLPWLRRSDIESLLEVIAPFCKSTPVLKDDEALEEREIEPFKATGNFDRDLATFALANMAWVRPLFGDAARPTSGGYDVASAALGRPLEERLSIHRRGIRDWGTHDLNDPREGRRTAVEVVMEWAGPFEVTLDGAPIVTRGQAEEWLCRQFGSTRSDLRMQWRGERDAELASYFEEPEPGPFEDAPTVTAEHHRGRVYYAGDDGPPHQRALIKGLIDERTVNAIGGQSGAGKTFVSIDLAVSMGSGQDFFGKKIKQRVGTLFVAYEGFGALGRRINAACRERGAGDAPVGYVEGEGVLTGNEALMALIVKIKGAAEEMRERFDVPLGHVIIDTMGAAFGMVDENNNAEANEIIRRLKIIRSKTGCAVSVVHHFGKNEAAGLRGASAFRGGFDSVVAVLADRSEATGAVNNRRVALAKHRDGEEGPISGFRLKEVVTGTDIDGDVLKTCVIVHTEQAPAPKPKEKPLNKAAKWVLQAFHDVAKDGKQEADEHGVIGVTVDRDAVRARFAEIYPANGDTSKKRDHARTVSFGRGLEEAVARGDLVTRNVDGVETVRGEV